MELATYKDFYENKDGERNAIQPFEIDNLQPFGIDLTVGEPCFNLTSGEKMRLDGNRIVCVQPGDFIIVHTHETLDVPNCWFGLVSSKVSLMIEGFTQLGTKVDPGFKGRLQLAFKNDGTSIVELKKGDPICNVAFFRLPEEPGTAYKGLFPKPVTLMLPFSFRSELTEEELERVRGRYSRELVDFYKTFWDRINTQREDINKAERMVYGLIVGVVVAFLAAMVAIILSAVL